MAEITLVKAEAFNALTKKIADSKAALIGSADNYYVGEIIFCRKECISYQVLDESAETYDEITAGLEKLSLLPNPATDDADRAEAAADAAELALSANLNVYADTTAGLAATSDGQQFQVVDGDVVVRYRNDTGVAVELARYPLAQALSDLQRLTANILQTTSNLFNPNDPDYTEDYFVNWLYGTLSASADYDASGYIPVSASTDYYISNASHYAWYDATKTFISGVEDVAGEGWVPAAVTSPATAAYLRLSVKTASGVDPNSVYVIPGAVPLETFEAYGGTVNFNAIYGSPIAVRLVDFVETGKNLFDKEAATPDSFMGSLGALGSSATYVLSDYIEVEPGETYHGAGASNGMRFWTAFSENKSLVTAEGSDVAGTTITVPASGVKYYRVTLYTSDFDTFQFEKGAAATAYEGFGYRLKQELPQTVIPDGVSTFIETGKNLFDKDAVLADTYMGSLGVPNPSATYALSDFIEVEPGETYYGAGASHGMRFRTAYGPGKNLITAEGSDVEGTSLTVPSDGSVKYYRVTAYTSDLDSFQFEKSATQTGYEAFGYRLKRALPVESSSNLSNWADLVCASYGDSITFQSEWQPAIMTEHGLVHTAYGVGGRQIGGATGMCQQAQIDTIVNNPDLIIAMGGVNDWAQSRALGAISSVDDTEFYGALNLMCQRLTTTFPSARIVLGTPTYSEFADGNWETRGGWYSGVRNAQNLSTHDYAAAVRAVAAIWGFPVIDFAAEEGVNTVNIDPYRNDDGNHIHPNDLGGARMAAVGIGRLYDIQPV